MKTLLEKLDHALDWRSLQMLADWTLDQTLAIQRLPAPTFNERQRAEYVAEQMRALGVEDIEIDEISNVYGVIRGTHPAAPGLMVSAHLDTVFPLTTDLTATITPTTVQAPGIGDNSVAVAGLLALAKWLGDGHRLQCDVMLVATTREEGLGNLDGMRAAFARLRERVGYVINLEGLAFGHIYNAGIAVRRLLITAETDGGHSWLHFGRPSATHALITLGAKITALRPLSNPRTTFNIGIIEGGEAINAIATSARLWLDLRSEERAAVLEIERQVGAFIEDPAAGIRWSIDVVGDRPSGYLAPDHPLVQAAGASLVRVGVVPTLETGSTDANIPLSEGCPAVTICITRGGNAHRTDEYIEIEPIAQGLKQLILLAHAVASGLEETDLKSRS